MHLIPLSECCNRFDNPCRCFHLWESGRNTGLREVFWQGGPFRPASMPFHTVWSIPDCKRTLLIPAVFLTHRFRSIESLLVRFRTSRGPFCAEKLGLRQDEFGGLVLQVGRIAVFAEDSFNQNFDFGTGAFA